MTDITQEQIATLAKRLRIANGYAAPDFATPLAEPIKLEAADMLEQLAADILTVCQREAAMIARYDAKLDALERAKPAGVSLRPFNEDDRAEIVNSAYAQMKKHMRGGARGQTITEWDSIESWVIQETKRRVLAALEPAPDAPVTVSSTEQDLGALVEHFKAKAEKAYADGVRDAAKVAEYEAEYVPLKPGDMTRAILALLKEKSHD